QGHHTFTSCCPPRFHQRLWCIFCVGQMPALFSESLTAQLYVSILESTMLPAAQDWFDDGHWTYVQDSGPKHTAKLTQDWLRTHVPEYITPQQWAPRSPDLNPIE